MTKRGFLINLDTCLDHRGCMTACKMYNDTPMGVYNCETLTSNDGVYPYPNLYFVSRLCQQCDNPACMAACGKGAIAKREDGIVIVSDQASCSACDDPACQKACPYGAITHDAKTGKTYKCDMCSARLDAGERPRCIKGCLTGSRFIGDLDDPFDAISQIIEGDANNVHQLKVSAGTGPNVYYYLSKKRWDDDKHLYDPNWTE